MSMIQRIQIYVEHLSKENSLTVSTAMDLTKVGASTVRRDFSYLTEKQLVNRYFGGIQLKLNDLDASPPFALRLFKNLSIKRKIAKKAASLVKNGDAIFFDGGTTTFRMAEYILDKDITVITNSVFFGQFIGNQKKKGNLKVHLTGGELYTEGQMMLGPRTINAINMFHTNLAFISIGGIRESGLFDNSELVAQITSKIIYNSDKTIILADSSKFLNDSTCFVCSLDQIDTIITDKIPNNFNCHFLTC